MERQEVCKEIKNTLGIVPGFLNMLPDSSMELEWQLMKRVQMDPGPIPNKYRELIGLAVAAATKCKYCTVFHTEGARMNGATEAEIEDAVHFAKSSMGWSTYLNGMQYDYDRFKAEVAQIGQHVSSMQPVATET